MYHRQKKWEVQIKIILLLVAVIYGLLDYFLPATKTISDSVFRTFIVALLLFIVQELFEISNSQKAMQSGFSSKSLQKFMIDNKGLLADLACEFTTELEKSIKVDDEKLIINHLTLAISSYLTFWRLLADVQGKKKEKLTLLAIHSCDINIWTNHLLTKQLHQKQQKFISEGGIVERILCGTEATANQTIIDVAKQMKQSGVKVFYYDLSSDCVPDHTFTWDFAHVVQTGETSIWDTFSQKPGGGIERAIYTQEQEYNGQNIAVLWANIRQHSVEL